MSESDVGLGNYEKWRIVDVSVKRDVLSKIGLWRLVWGADIFINDIPILKCYMLANIIVWILMYFTLR